MVSLQIGLRIIVICRVGSLEMRRCRGRSERTVICRVGSLETGNIDLANRPTVICRVGSLEIDIAVVQYGSKCYLPSRQFRN